jgi:hypothetical protein
MFGKSIRGQGSGAVVLLRDVSGSLFPADSPHLSSRCGARAARHRLQIFGLGRLRVHS